MIADLIDDKLHIRLITRNVMSVYSTDSKYTDDFILKLKHSFYTINYSDKQSYSNTFIAYLVRDYNKYKNIFRYISKYYNIKKFTEYLNFFNKNHLLWLHFSDLSDDDLCLIECLILLLSNKQIIILDYFDDRPFASQMMSLLFKIGLEDKLIIYPCKDVNFGINNSTCQCFVQSADSVKIQTRFLDHYLSEQLNSKIHYTSYHPAIYNSTNNYIIPQKYSYTLYEIILIIMFSIKMICIKIFNWRYEI